MGNSTTTRIALYGNPNCGKSSLFNHLTGLQQKISNVPGTTIERRVGKFKVFDTSFEIIDTPGTYSLTPNAKDEEVALELMEDDKHSLPDIIAYVADARNLKRHLYFFSQLADYKIPMILIVNMVDSATAYGIEVDQEALQQQLGIPIIFTNARKGEGVDLLRKTLVGKRFVPHFDFAPDSNKDAVIQRYDQIDKLLENTIKIKSKGEQITERLDRVLTHPVFGYAIFLVLLFVIFQCVFWLAQYPMEWIESGFNFIGDFFINTLPEGWFRSLFVNGIIAGLAGVVVFVPQIAILFFFMGIMEDTGYMSRVSFIMDKIVRGFGLNGKSVVPLISGVACAIPAIMATRTIENWKDRMITIMVTPLMSCSARLPVYTLLIAVAVPDTMVLGIISLKGLVLLAMYLIGVFGSLFAALIFKFIIRQKRINYFILELPTYHKPRWKNIGVNVWNKSRSFVTGAGKIIVLVSIVLWFLASYGPNPSSDSSMSIHETTELEASYAGKFGKVIEPAIKPLGFNWKIGIALLTSFAAREVFVGTMSTIYSVEDENDLVNIRTKMRDEHDENGKVYSLAVVLSLMVFYAFAMQCMSTLAVVYKETKSMKWPLIQFAYMTALAYISSFIVYQIFV